MMFLGKVIIAVGAAWVAYAILDNASTFQVCPSTSPPTLCCALHRRY